MDDETIPFSEHVIAEIREGRWIHRRGMLDSPDYICSPERPIILVGDEEGWYNTFTLVACMEGWWWNRKPRAYLVRGSYRIDLDASEHQSLYDAFVYARAEQKVREKQAQDEYELKRQRASRWP